MDTCKKVLERKDGRDYDCFYASVFEAENPALKSLPLAVQQKQIIVTCNYEARKRGFHKLQLIREAKIMCPEVVIVLAEDLTRFRDASKALYNFLKDFSWNGRVEKLGFDEVWMDVTDIIDYNLDLLNGNDLLNSFFHLSKDDPTLGFGFDGSKYIGHTYPAVAERTQPQDSAEDVLCMRLRLGSHLAQHIRHQLEERKGYTATVGISTSKLLSKLVGSVNKPKAQTTLVPPYVSSEGLESSVTTFIDSHDVGKIPGIGFKAAHKIREHVLHRDPDFDAGLTYGGMKEKVTVRDVRLSTSMSAESLEKVLAGPGSPHGLGYRVWCLINGLDDSEVGQVRSVPKQISIEDSYIRLDTVDEVLKELRMLAKNLIKRMRLDLLETDDDGGESSFMNESEADQADGRISNRKRWLAHPKTLRLTTRPRPPLNPDGTRTRTFSRVSRSAPLPGFVSNLQESVDALAAKLVTEALVPLFKKLHPEKSGWNLSLVNVAVTNMADTASDKKSATGRDIARMFSRQEDVLKEWRSEDRDASSGTGGGPSSNSVELVNRGVFADAPVGFEDGMKPQHSMAADEDWGDEENSVEQISTCQACGSAVPSFAMPAHQRYHLLGD
ncbi:hypothetical protein LTR16_001483 [Cryomyces antarcticus]|uniref:UmuC domain-containing protein n=1 Tax=Cryomyces antarcticus TaxID=329879 RepID=A0ABR0M107_9PEZI|nr:hypothetical protein LTR16_001483 [Cryomyces antarcticus]